MASRIWPLFSAAAVTGTRTCSGNGPDTVWSGKSPEMSVAATALPAGFCTWTLSCVSPSLSSSRVVNVAVAPVRVAPGVVAAGTALGAAPCAAGAAAADPSAAPTRAARATPARANLPTVDLMDTSFRKQARPPLGR